MSNNIYNIYAIYYRLKNMRKDGTVKKWTIVKMCGSSMTKPEFGLFVDGRIRLNFGYRLDGYRQQHHKHFGIFWWLVR